MKNHRSNPNSFFIEIILVILFFTLSASVTLQLFVAANSRARQSSELSIAVLKSEDIAEQVKSITSVDSVPYALKNAAHTTSGGAEHYRLTFDRQWNETSSNPRYTLEVTLKKQASQSGTTVVADIAVSRIAAGSENSIYKLGSSKYLPKAP